MARDNLNRVRAVRPRILQWHAKNKRSFIWRDTPDPYTILVSEIMLQQTQTSRIQEKLPVFLKHFPTLRALAESPRAEVVRAWKGIGYNNRAVRLHELAQLVLRNYNGRLPRTIEQLQALPGIGPYTSHAVACFAFREQVPVVDVNIQRVLSRIFWKMKTFSDRQTPATVWKIAQEVLPDDAYSWNQAVMDLGAAVCSAARPLCGDCPVSNLCSSSHLEHGRLGRRSTPRVRARKPEPSYNGIPRRLWRGRIVEALRNVEGDRPLAVAELGRAIKSDFRVSELPWLIRVVNRLAEDGVVYRVGASNDLKVSLSAE